VSDRNSAPAAGSRPSRDRRGGNPPPLFLQTTPLDAVEDRLVYALGYPLIDNSGDTPEEVIHTIFRDALGIKRFQPGKLLGFDTDPRRVLHDCSTLGGSSGSCIVDYVSGVVVA